MTGHYILGQIQRQAIVTLGPEELGELLELAETVREVDTCLCGWIRILTVAGETVSIIVAIREVSDSVLIAYHSCGHVEPVVGELADAGVQVLESVQPEANDVARLVREHGDRLSFWGTVGDQSVLPYGTPEEVRQQVRSRIETVGRDGGLMIAPAHVVEPEVPVENVFAFFEAVEEFGRYA